MQSLSTVGPGDWPTIAAHRAPSTPALRTADGVECTYAEFEARTARLSVALETNGVRAGDRIAILDTDSFDYAFLLFAAFKIGAVVVPLNFRLSGAELAALVRTAAPTVLVTGERYEALREQLLAGCSPSLVLRTTELTEFTDAASAIASRPASTRDEDTLLWMLTSGTTGTPRVVAQSQRMIKANTVKGIVEQAFRPDDRLYAGTPLFHTAGSGWLFWAVARGASALLLPQFDAGVVADCLDRGLITRCLLVPSMALALLDHPALHAPVADLRSIAYGGAAMPPTVVTRLHETFGCDLYNTFGAGTEGGGQTILRPEDHRAAFAGEPELLGSIGRAMYGVDLELRDEDGVEVPVGVIGEIWTRSDTVMSGYVGRDDLTARRVVDGWVGGGDLARRDANGYLYLAGRKDDMIVRGGENIHPAEIEHLLAEHPGVADSCVLGLADDYWGQIVVAAVVPRPDAGLDEASVLAHCRGRLASYKLPARVAFVADLPRNSAGKVLRAAVRERLSAAVTSGV